MCNHFRNQPDKLATWAHYIGADLRADLSDVGDAYPARPSQTESKWPAAVVIHGDGGWILDTMLWGIVTTVKGAKGPIKKPVTNIRNLSSPFWRGVLSDRAQRCLVPFSTFAEPKAGAGREEHWFSVVDRPVAAFAGVWRLSEGAPRCAFLTCDPNPLVAPLHPKAMPVILNEEDYGRWMDGADAAELAQPYPSQLMSFATAPSPQPAP